MVRGIHVSTTSSASLTRHREGVVTASAAARSLAPTGRGRPGGRCDLVFKALASATRRRILDVLRESSCTTGALCARFPDLDRTTVLQHLRTLERAELVTGRRIGRERHLSLAPLPIKGIYDRWVGEYTRAAVELLSRLESVDPP